MKGHCFLILALLAGAALAFAGCTTPSAPAATPTAAPAPSLASLALTQSDLPAGYVMTESRQKNASELSPLAMKLGWQDGYIAKFTNSTAPAGSQDIILQTITTYPESSMPNVLEYVSKADRSYSDIAYTDLTLAGLGKNGGGFAGKVRAGDQPAAMIIVPTTASPLSSAERLSSTPQSVPYGQNLAEVYFARGTTFEVIRMSGPHASGEEVLKLAQVAYSKIP
jgi:hypothetical protein